MSDLVHLPELSADLRPNDIVAMERARLEAELAHPAPWYGRYIRFLVGDYRYPSFRTMVWHIIQLVPIAIVAFLLMKVLPGLGKADAEGFGVLIRAASLILAAAYAFLGAKWVAGEFSFKRQLFVSVALHVVPPLGLIAQIPRIYARLRYGSKLKDPDWVDMKLQQPAQTSDATILRAFYTEQIEATRRAIIVGTDNEDGSMRKAQLELQERLKDARALEEKIERRLKNASPERRQTLEDGLATAKTRREKIQAANDKHDKAMAAAEEILARCETAVDQIDGAWGDAELLKELGEQSIQDDAVLERAAQAVEAAAERLQHQILSPRHACTFHQGFGGRGGEGASGRSRRERNAAGAPGLRGDRQPAPCPQPDRGGRRGRHDLANAKTRRSGFSF